MSAALYQNLRGQGLSHDAAVDAWLAQNDPLYEDAEAATVRLRNDRIRAAHASGCHLPDDLETAAWDVMGGDDDLSARAEREERSEQQAAQALALARPGLEQEIIARILSGQSQAEIARARRVSRQRIHALLARVIRRAARARAIQPIRDVPDDLFGDAV